jgi:hypothetical protein
MASLCNTLNIQTLKMSSLSSYTNIDGTDIFMIIESGSALYSRKTTAADVASYVINSGLSGSYTGSFSGSGVLHGTFSGSTYGTSSHAVTASHALSASHATSASHALNTTTASYSLTTAEIVSASYATTSSYALSSGLLSASYAVTASYATSANTSPSSSYAITSSYALSASYAENGFNGDGIGNFGTGIAKYDTSTDNLSVLLIAGTHTVAHELTTTPSLIHVSLICTTTSVGYSVDDEVELGAVIYNDFPQRTTYPASSISSDATNVVVTFHGGITGLNPSFLYMINKSSRGFVQMGVGELINWNVKIRAWK